MGVLANRAQTTLIICTFFDFVLLVNKHAVQIFNKILWHIEHFMDKFIFLLVENIDLLSNQMQLSPQIFIILTFGCHNFLF